METTMIDVLRKDMYRLVDAICDGQIEDSAAMFRNRDTLEDLAKMAIKTRMLGAGVDYSIEKKNYKDSKKGAQESVAPKNDLPSQD
ncbi:MAG: hypothetical protein FWE31_03830 [Firmicutes bacterium]|nr:hypothetical protein [Bacillota bacterium]